MQSPKKSSMRISTASPGKKWRNTVVVTQQLVQSQDESQELQFAIGERDVEIERMKITLVALNEKLAVTNDIRLDCDQHKQYLSQSEQQRANLQAQIMDTAEEILKFQGENSKQ